MFAASEQLRDSELRHFSNCFREAMAKENSTHAKILLNDPTRADDLANRDTITIYFEKSKRAPVQLLKLINLDIGMQSEMQLLGVSEKQRTIEVYRKMELLVKLIDRATGPSS